MHGQSLHSCLTLWDSMDCSPPGSSVRGILRARILEWVIMPSSKGSFWPRDQTCVSCVADRFFTHWTTLEAPLSGYTDSSSSWDSGIPPHPPHPDWARSPLCPQGQTGHERKSSFLLQNLKPLESESWAVFQSWVGCGWWFFPAQGCLEKGGGAPKQSSPKSPRNYPHPGQASCA